MKKEDEFYYALKDRWTGRRFIGVASRYCYDTRALVLAQREITWDEMRWNSMGSYLLEIMEEDERYHCLCQNFFILRDGIARLYTSNFVLARKFIECEIDYRHLIEVKNE